MERKGGGGAWGRTYVRFGKTETGLLNLVKGRGKWSPSGATAAAVDKGMTVSDRMRPIESRLVDTDRYSRMSWSSSVCSTCPSDTAFAST